MASESLPPYGYDDRPDHVLRWDFWSLDAATALQPPANYVKHALVVHLLSYIRRTPLWTHLLLSASLTAHPSLYVRVPSLRLQLVEMFH